MNVVAVPRIPEPDRELARKLELVEAQRDAALDMLRDVVTIVRRIGGHMDPKDQATMREARATLAEHGRSVP